MIVKVLTLVAVVALFPESTRVIAAPAQSSFGSRMSLKVKAGWRRRVDRLEEILVEQKFMRQSLGLKMKKKMEELRKQFNSADAVDYLQRYGYAESDSSKVLPSQPQESDLVKFQVLNQLEPTGTLDNETIQVMVAPRCDFPDIMPNAKGRRIKRFVLSRYKWQLKELPLTVRFKNYSPVLGTKEQENVFMQAARTWAQYSGLRFVKTKSADAHLTVEFKHIDGKLRVLGRAFRPKVGKIYFEKEENWVPKILNVKAKRPGISFLAVALHEIGHAVGIQHSLSGDNSIMTAQYSRHRDSLSRDDITAIQEMYGENGDLTPLQKAAQFIPKPQKKKLVNGLDKAERLAQHQPSPKQRKSRRNGRKQ